MAEIKSKKICVVLENPKTIYNIGSIIRTICAFGIDLLIIIDDKNLYKMNKLSKKQKHALSCSSAGVSKNTFIQDNIIVFDSIEKTIEYLHADKFISIATSPHINMKNNIKLNELNISDNHIAIWFGNEDRGLSKESLSNIDCKICVQIPLSSNVESLNLSVSVGIILYAITKL
jgi:tRNA (guanosine-2'-O-)-methyltransferase